MLQMVEVWTAQGSLLSLPLDDISDGIIVSSIDGLDPVKATLVSSSFARQDGEQYQSARREARNITVKLELEPDFITESVRDVRSRLYEFFMPKSMVTLRFHTSIGLDVEIQGVVESMETPMFTKDPEVDISIMCFDPDFKSLEPVVFNGVSTSSTLESVLPYSGTVETGFELTLNVNRTMSEFTLYHRPPDGTIRSMEFTAALVAGDVVTISTVSGAKGAILNRAGAATAVSSILYAISPQSNWIELSPGENRVRLYAEGAAVPFTIAYTTRYGGL